MTPLECPEKQGLTADTLSARNQRVTLLFFSRPASYLTHPDPKRRQLRGRTLAGIDGCLQVSACDRQTAVAHQAAGRVGLRREQ